MADLTVRIVSERRDGLLIEIGRVVTRHGYRLLRQQMVRDPQGVSLRLELRGPEEDQLGLEEAIAVHPRVLGFESEHGTAEPDAGKRDTPARRMPEAPVAKPRPAPSGRPAVANRDEVERVLPQMARDYPKITPWILNLGQSVSNDEHAASLHLAGTRTGIWVFKRDYSRGAKLSLSDATKRIITPALQALVKVERSGERIYIKGSPICSPGKPSGCPFFRGFVEALLGEATDSHSVFVRESSCCGTGAPDCVLEVSN
jgi:hypothetical protein